MPERVLKQTRFQKNAEKNAFFFKKTRKRQNCRHFDNDFLKKIRIFLPTFEFWWSKMPFFRGFGDRILKIRRRRSIRLVEIYKSVKSASKTASKRGRYGRLKSTPLKKRKKTVIFDRILTKFVDFCRPSTTFEFWCSKMLFLEVWTIEF